MAFRQVDTRHGLLSNTIRALDCDTSGLLWIGTTAGVVAFDGYRMIERKFECGHKHDVSRIVASLAHPLVFTYDSVYEWRDNRLRPLRTIEPGEVDVHAPKIKGLEDVDLNGWAIDANGNYWLSIYNGGLSIVDKDGNIHYMKDNPYALLYPVSQTTAIHIDQRGILWVGTYKSGLMWTLANKRGSAFMPNKIKDNVSYVFRDSAGRIVTSIDGAGVSIADWHLSVANGALDTDLAVVIKEASPGQYLLGTYSGGLYQIDWEGHKSTKFAWRQPSEAEMTDCVQDFVIDSAGRLWIATFHKGLVMAEEAADGKWDIKQHYQLGTSEMPNSTIMHLAYNQAKNEIGVATPSGMAIVNLSTLELKNVAQAANLFVHTLTYYNGLWWLGCPEGLVWIDLALGERGAIADVDQPIIDLLAESCGVLHAVAYNKIWSLEPSPNGGYQTSELLVDWLPIFDGMTANSGSIDSDDTMYVGCGWGYVEFPTGCYGSPKHRAIKFMGITSDGHFVDSADNVPLGLPIDILISDLSYWGSPKYEYNLDGNAWVVADEGKIHLGALPAGYYQLAVRHTGHLNEKYIMKFRVGEWWQHPLFKAFMVLLIAAAVVAAVVYVRYLLRKRKPFEVRAVPVENEEQNTPDAKFLRKVASVVEANMTQEEFGVEQLAEEVGMSRTTLFRRVKALTGTTPFDLIQGMRVERGHELLQKGKMTVKNVSWEVGMTPRQFSAAYKKRYGNTPGKTKGDTEADGKCDTEAVDKGM